MKQTYMVFDADGTLLDSMHIWQNIGSRYLQTQGLTARPNLLPALENLNLDQAAEYLCANYPLDKVAAVVIQQIGQLLTQEYQQTVTLKPGVKEFIREQKKAGKKLYIATSSEYSYIAMALAEHGILKYFEEIYTCSSIGLSKSDQRFFGQLAQLLSAEPRELTIFDDNLDALLAAKAAGCYVTGVYDQAFKAQSEAIKQIADDYIDTFMELIKRKI